jgi:hypothetical protein
LDPCTTRTVVALPNHTGRRFNTRLLGHAFPRFFLEIRFSIK